MNSNNLDQFYTDPSVAKQCLDLLEQIITNTTEGKDYYTYIEPSAGTGAFSNQLQNCLAFDLDPKDEKIKKQDFLKLDPNTLKLKKEKTIIVGNPPFGKCSSLAVKFFNHASSFGDTIAFIVPRTFKKESIHRKLALNFHLTFEWEIPKRSFIYNNEKYDVPCVFQIWVKKDFFREKNKNITKNNWFEFVKKTEAEAAIRRVGGRAGKATVDFSPLSESSHYFIKKLDRSITIQEIVEVINSIDFKSVVSSTAGVRSLSKPELIEFFEKKIKNP